VLVTLQNLDGVSVDDDVLGCRGQGREEGKDADHGNGDGSHCCMGQAQAKDDEQDLTDEDPAALSAEQRRREAVHEGRPEELHGPRQLGEAKQPDDPDVDADPRHPRGNGDPD
jgi:hypothetical protein